jgi:hypothetical protein
MGSTAADLGRVRGQDRVPGGGQPLLGSGQAAGRQRVQVAGAHALVLDQACVAQHPQVLADRRTADRKPLGQLPDRSRPVMQQLEDAPAHRLPQRVERGFRSLVTHQ